MPDFPLTIDLVLAYGTAGGIVNILLAYYLHYIRIPPAPTRDVAQSFVHGAALLAFSSPLYLSNRDWVLGIWALGYTILIGLSVRTFLSLQYGRIAADLREYLRKPRLQRRRPEEPSQPP